MTTYRIVGWDRYFENNRTRELKYMEWVPIPVRMDGDGYTQLVDGPEGPANLGIWLAIVEIAAGCDPRGTLLRTPLRSTPRPHTTATLARISRLPEEHFKRVIPLLINIGWIETCEETASSCDIPAPRRDELPTERNGTERKYTPPPVGAKWGEQYHMVSEAIPASAPAEQAFTYHDFVGLFSTSHRGMPPEEIVEELIGRIRHEPVHRWAQYGIVRCLDYMLGDIAKNFRKAEPTRTKEEKPLGKSRLPS